MPEIDSSQANKKALSYFLLVIGLLVASFLFAFGLLVNSHYKTITNSPNEAVATIHDLPESKYTSAAWQKIINGTETNYFGARDAKLTIVEFGDFTCAFCKSSYPKIRELGLKNYKNVKILFRHRPSSEFAIDLAMAAECAGEQGLFWPMHDKLFQEQNNIDVVDLTTMAVGVGVNKNKFNECINERRYLDKIKQDHSDADVAAVPGTPTFFIDGRMFSGDIPEDMLTQVVDLILANK